MTALQYVLTYKSEEGPTSIDVMLETGTPWLSHKLFTVMRVSSKSPGETSP